MYHFEGLDYFFFIQNPSWNICNNRLIDPCPLYCPRDQLNHHLWKNYSMYINGPFSRNKEWIDEIIGHKKSFKKFDCGKEGVITSIDYCQVIPVVITGKG